MATADGCNLKRQSLGVCGRFALTVRRIIWARASKRAKGTNRSKGGILPERCAVYCVKRTVSIQRSAQLFPHNRTILSPVLFLEWNSMPSKHTFVCTAPKDAFKTLPYDYLHACMSEAIKLSVITTAKDTYTHIHIHMWFSLEI